MKKNYIIPSVFIVNLNTCSIIAGSPDKVSFHTQGGSGTDLVKENTTTPDYNVWDDDWSKN